MPINSQKDAYFLRVCPKAHISVKDFNSFSLLGNNMVTTVTVTIRTSSIPDGLGGSADGRSQLWLGPQ
jgi:hypothetical protein